MTKTTVAAAPNEIAKLLEEAASRGHLVILRTSPPPHDEAQTQLHIVLNQLFGLTLAESRLFVTLLKYDRATKAQLHAALSPGGAPVTSIKVVGVNVHWLRKKLSPHEIEIVSIHGSGYRLAKGDRERTRKLLAEYGEDIVAAVTPPAGPAAAPAD